MPAIDTKHPDYVKQQPAWEMMRDLVAGQRAIHSKAEKYLPRLVDESDKAYEARKGRALFFNATHRTIEALVGMLFRKAPEIEHDARIESMLLDVTKSGQPVDLFAYEVALELQTVYKVGVLTDYPATSTEGMNLKQAEEANIRPHVAMYRAEDIINWRYSWINGRNQMSLVVLAEREIVGGDEFAPLYEDRWRVLDMAPVAMKDAQGNPTGEARWVYRQRVYRKDKGTGEFVIVDGSERAPMMGGQYLTEIPFEVFGDGIPPLEDLGHVNLSHYLSTADLEHGAHQTALPQAWASGVERQIDPITGHPRNVKMYIGGGDLWMFPGQAQVGMLEYTGQGLSALENRLAAKEKQMAVLGARMLEQQKSGVESAEAAGIHRSGEQSTLQAQAARLSLGMSRVLSWFEKWAGGPGAVKFEINRDFMPVGLDAQAITALVGAWQAGAISKEALFLKLQKGGVVSDATNFEDEETKIDTAPPMTMQGAAPELTTDEAE